MTLISHLTADHFTSSAVGLRKEFSGAFADPRKTTSKRFVWDMWYQPQQYRHLRTPANHFFSKKLFYSFLKDLTHWGQEHLGCSALSPPWLSYYVDGCFQNLHGDVPHGPFAYVFSLTKNSNALSGGRTLLLRDSILDFWKGLNSSRGFESADVFNAIENKFNRLVVFDPRIPHGVEEVRGVLDPLDSRVVIHGWFTEPMPFVTGGLKKRQSDIFLNRVLPELINKLPRSGASGLNTLKILISKDGRVRKVENLIDTLRGFDAYEKREWQKALTSIKEWRAPKSPSASTIVLPLYLK